MLKGPLYLCHPLPSLLQAKGGSSSKAGKSSKPGKSVKATKAKKRPHSSIPIAAAIAAAGPEDHTTLPMAGNGVDGIPSKVCPFVFVSSLCCIIAGLCRFVRALISTCGLKLGDSKAKPAIQDEVEN